MGNHVHISALAFLTVALFIIMFGVAWRTVATRYSDTAVGKAMAYIY